MENVRKVSREEAIKHIFDLMLDSDMRNDVAKNLNEDDQEVLAYMVRWEFHRNCNIEENVGVHNTSFDCYCFNCYLDYMKRWEKASSKCQEIDTILERCEELYEGWRCASSKKEQKVADVHNYGQDPATFNHVRPAQVFSVNRFGCHADAEEETKKRKSRGKRARDKKMKSSGESVRDKKMEDANFCQKLHAFGKRILKLVFGLGHHTSS